MLVRLLRIFIPLLVLVAGSAGAWYLSKAGPEVETEEREQILPLVRVLTVRPEMVQLRVRTQGTVTPRRETQLIAEVAGKVVEVSPSLLAGGFFESGEVLLRLERRDYELAVIQAEAQIAREQLRLEQELAEAEVARKEWEEIGQGRASPLTLRQPQLAQARAAVEAAKAALEQARRDLTRTEIRAPFAGRIRSENVDIGQYVNRGSSLAQLYSVDYAEVRLPLPDEELAFVDLPLSYRERTDTTTGPEVLLKARFAGREHVWRGRIVRTEGEIDTQTRMLYAVAEVENPYGRGQNPGRPPLAVGLFVQAEILGRRIPDVVSLPRSVLRGENQVLVVDQDNRLYYRNVEILRLDGDRALISAGLEVDERVCLSALETVVEGMQVRIVHNGENL